VNGTLVHSKAGGHGYVDSAEKKQRILNAVAAALGVAASPAAASGACGTSGSCGSCH
jgi:ferredoxin